VMPLLFLHQLLWVFFFFEFFYWTWQKMFVHLKKFLIKLLNVSKKKFNLYPTFLDAKLVTQHPQISLVHQNLYTYISVCRMHNHVLWNKIFQSIFFGANFCNGDKNFGKNLRFVIFQHNFDLDWCFFNNYSSFLNLTKWGKKS
jgi:hypothetical protein